MGRVTAIEIFRWLLFTSREAGVVPVCGIPWILSEYYRDAGCVSLCGTGRWDL